MRLIPLVLCLGACGGASAESPLTVRLGLSHDATESALKQHEFCLERSSSTVSSTQQKQVYPRCNRAASEAGDAWVVARYDGDKLIELRRFERYGDDNRALERWNELITARMKTSKLDDAAIAQLKEGDELEPGTKSVKAFRDDQGAVVGVYLLTPSPPDNANVLEKITFAK